ncbi:ACT domain-containing protein [Nonomuraea sp. NBC_01738]|uniref:ACT domain-containing protein n=1 Tax=Nonomuraea sp. NBC_01738 TaxID=2976003 RepID=UPI002E13F8BF|nr:ACT domain-containing protein [Nonomuraea sp. NBC_01738]
MLLRLRVSLPDRPGGLGQVARALGALGADILQVTVLEREAGRAVDEFTLDWPGLKPGPGLAGEAAERLSGVPGVRVEGAWPTREVPGSAPDYDLLTQVAADPSRGFATLVDALPSLCGADWAIALSGGLVRHASLGAPEMFALSDPPLRPAMRMSDELSFMAMPAEDLHIVVARGAGPAFHRAELSRAARIVDVVSRLAGRTAGTRT